MIGCYVRVSTAEQANEGYSVGEQTERLKKYAEAMGWSNYKIYTDGGFSGANMDRPALQKMIKDIKARLIDRVLVYKLDRLSRSQKDTLYLIEDVFLANGCDFVSMNENFDTSSPFGRAMIGILAVFSQLEREQIRERMTMGLEARAKEGKFHGSAVAPIGYDYIDGQLVIDEFEAMQIKSIFEKYVSGYSPNKIVDDLNSRGLTHKYGKWTRKVLRRALSRKTYLGKIEHKGKVYDGLHEPIISQELFDAAQRAQKERAHEFESGQRNGTVNSYLGGLVYCAHCGAKYCKKTKYQTNKSVGKPYYYYICNSRHKKTESLIKDPNCKNKTWKMSELDDLVFNEMKKLALDPEYLKRVKGSKTKDIRPKAIERKIKEIDGQLSKLMELYALDGIPMDDLQAKINDLNTKKLKLSEEKTKILLEQELAITKKEAMQLLGSFEDVLESGSFEEIRAIITALIEKIEIDGDDVTIFWKFS